MSSQMLDNHKEVGMEIIPVQSSHIDGIGHEGSTMEVHFAGDRKYTYEGVSAEAFAEIQAAESTGIALRQLGIVGTRIVEDEE